MQSIKTCVKWEQTYPSYMLLKELILKRGETLSYTRNTLFQRKNLLPKPRWKGTAQRLCTQGWTETKKVQGRHTQHWRWPENVQSIHTQHSWLGSLWAMQATPFKSEESKIRGTHHHQPKPSRTLWAETPPWCFCLPVVSGSSETGSRREVSGVKRGVWGVSLPTSKLWDPSNLESGTEWMDRGKLLYPEIDKTRQPEAC